MGTERLIIVDVANPVLASARSSPKSLPRISHQRSSENLQPSSSSILTLFRSYNLTTFPLWILQVYSMLRQEDILHNPRKMTPLISPTGQSRPGDRRSKGYRTNDLRGFCRQWSQSIHLIQRCQSLRASLQGIERIRYLSSHTTTPPPCKHTH